MTTTIQNNEFWQTKLLARIHDPAEKALVLMNTTEGHEGGTVADLKKEFFNQDQISKLYPIYPSPLKVLERVSEIGY